MRGRRQESMTARVSVGMSRGDAAVMRERARAHERSLSAEIRAALDTHLADPLRDADVQALPRNDVLYHIACPPDMLEALHDVGDRSGRSAGTEARLAVRRHLGVDVSNPSQPQLITT